MDKKLWEGWHLSKPIKNNKEFGHDRRRYASEVKKYRLKVKLLEFFDSLSPGAMAGNPGLEISHEILQKLVMKAEEIGQKAESDNLLKFLRKGLTKARDVLFWLTDLPPVPVKIFKEKNNYTPTSAVLIPQIKYLIERFQKLLLLDCNSIDLAYGQAIFSASVFGGLNNSKGMIQIPFIKNNLLRHAGFAWVDLSGESLPESWEINNLDLRRWFPDPITLILLTRLPDLPELNTYTTKGLEAKLNSCLKLFLYYLYTGSIEKESTAHVFSKISHLTWRESVRALHTQILPSYLVRHTTGSLATSAWSLPIWLRIVLKQKVLGLNSPQDFSDEQENINSNPNISLVFDFDETIKTALFKETLINSRDRSPPLVK